MKPNIHFVQNSKRNNHVKFDSNRSVISEDNIFENVLRTDDEVSDGRQVMAFAHMVFGEFKQKQNQTSNQDSANKWDYGPGVPIG